MEDGRHPAQGLHLLQRDRDRGVEAEGGEDVTERARDVLLGSQIRGLSHK